MLFPTTLVGSYPQPGWLIDREHLRVPRVAVPELWRVDGDHLREAQDDATRLAVRAQETAGIDVITDGEMRRESYSNRFATGLDGVDVVNPGTTAGRGAGGPARTVPRIVGPIARRHAIHADDVRFLRSITDRPIKITLPGPFTLSQQAQDDFYGDDAALAQAYAAVVRDEIKDCFLAGADVVQLDEPWMEARPERARAFGVEALTAATTDAAGPVAVHVCFGYGALVSGRPTSYSFLTELADAPIAQVSIETAQAMLDCSVLEQFVDQTVMLGVLDLSTSEIETPAVIIGRVERALQYIDAERVILAPDCGMKFLPRDSADGKLRAMVSAASQLRSRYGDQAN